MDDYPAAIEDFRMGLGIWERRLGAEDRSVAKGCGNVANVLILTGALDEARTLAERSLAIRRKMLDKNDPEIAHTLQTLARISQEQARFPEAITENQEALGILRRILGDEHPDVARSHGLMAFVYRDQELWDPALAELDTAVAIERNMLGDLSEVLAATLANRANIYYRKDDLVRAKADVDRAIGIEKRIGLNHGDPSPINLNMLAIIYNDMGQLDSATTCYENALRITKATLGPAHPNVGVLENNIGLLWFAKGGFSKARDHYRAAMAVFEKAFPDPHPQRANTWFNMATAYSYNDQYDSCMICSDSALVKYAALFGADHPVLAASYMYLIGCMVKYHGDMDRAWSLAQKNIDAMIKAKGPTGAHLALPYWAAGLVREEQKDLPGALDYQQRAVSALKLGDPFDVVRASRIEAMIGKLQHALGKDDRAIAALDSSSSFNPNSEALWYRYLIARDAGDDKKALDRLIECERMREGEVMMRSTARKEVKEALTALATRLGRKDVLEEFHLN